MVIDMRLGRAFFKRMGGVDSARVGGGAEFLDFVVAV